jgi:hypothetical protein
VELEAITPGMLGQYLVGLGGSYPKRNQQAGQSDPQWAGLRNGTPTRGSVAFVVGAAGFYFDDCMLEG